MHIEPGVLAPAKLLIANTAAVALLASHLPALARRWSDVGRSLLAALFFSLFMQAFHLSVGPSELHFIGAMPIYLAFGLLPTLFGFAIGLLAQGMLFEPQDLVHLGVNLLSLAVPLLVVHHTLGRRARASSLDPTQPVSQARTVLRLDGIYYAGVTLMVGFWLANGVMATPALEWLRFAGSYLAVVAFEPLVTLGVLALLRRHRSSRVVAACFAPPSALLAR